MSIYIPHDTASGTSIHNLRAKALQVLRTMTHALHEASICWTVGISKLPESHLAIKTYQDKRNALPSSFKRPRAYTVVLTNLKRVAHSRTYSTSRHDATSARVPMTCCKTPPNRTIMALVLTSVHRWGSALVLPVCIRQEVQVPYQPGIACGEYLYICVDTSSLQIQCRMKPPWYV